MATASHFAARQAFPRLACRSHKILFFFAQMCKALRLICFYFRRTVANYLLWRFVRHRVNNLDDRFQQVKQKFYYILFGREQAPSRWKNCVTQVNSNMDMAVGSMFVKKYFDKNSKNDVSIFLNLRMLEYYNLAQLVKEKEKRDISLFY